MKLAVFGANGPTGRLVTRLALNEDHEVVAFIRHPDAFPVGMRVWRRSAVTSTMWPRLPPR